MEPLIYGDYPTSMKKNAGARIPTFTRCELKKVKGSYDFIGVIHYMNINVSDNYGALNIKLRDFNADMAVNLICKYLFKD
jgi:beta-glucosidase